MVDNVEVVIAAEGMPGPSPASLNVTRHVSSSLACSQAQAEQLGPEHSVYP